MSAKNYVIIGNGVAGVTAAQELRILDREGKITIISNEDEYYYRASLSEWISKRNSREMMSGRTNGFYEQMNLGRMKGIVTKVDPQTHKVWVSDQAIPYHKLLIATGAQPNRIPIPGLEESLVFRSFRDAAMIQEQVGCCNRVLILGGGILGLELAGALHNLGIENIAVVQLMDYVGGPLLDQAAAEWLQAKMLTDGITLFLADTIDHVEEKTAIFKSGARWDFDLFVQSVGIRPQFPEVPGLETSRGIQINDQSRTNIADIFAAGDCTETYDPALERWMTTRVWLDGARQGRAAAYAMIGKDLEKVRSPFFNASLIYTERYGYFGDPHGEDGDSYVWKTETAYRKVRLVNGKLAGALLIGNRHGMMAMYRSIGLLVADAGAALAAPDYAWNELTGNDWDYYFY